MTSTTDSPATHPERRPVWAVALALVAALAVGALGTAYVLAQNPVYEAQVDVLVSPGKAANDSDAAALFDSLSRGQVAATAAEIFRQERWRDGQDGTVEAGVVTPSAVVQVTAQADSAAKATSLVQAVVTAADPEIDKALAPYQVARLDQTAPTADVVGLSRGLMLVLVLVAAVVAGAAVWRFAAGSRSTRGA
jgi:capsular polysaccharide biosynthesis protein